MTDHEQMALVPWPPSRVTEEPLGEVDVDRVMVFVPAIMSVGLVFSVVTLLRDAFHWTGHRARRRRTSIQAGAVASGLVGHPDPEPDDIGILSRPVYLISALVLVGGSAYVAIGSIANFLRDQGYVRDIGWLLAVSLVLAAILGFLGGVSLTVFSSWPHPPPWTLGSLRTAPLTSTPGQQGLLPSWGLTAPMLASAVVTGILTLIVGSGRSVAMDIDRPIARWLVEAEWIDRLAIFDPFGATLVSIGFVAVIGLSAFRCRVMAIVYPAAFLFSWLGAAAIREVIDRPRPIAFGDIESFPSGHLVQAVFIAGLLPLALRVLLSDRRIATVTQAFLGFAVVASALHRVHRQSHWPLDVLAGITLGLTVVLAGYWVLGHGNWHRGCSSCPWSPHPGETPWRRGVVTLAPKVARGVGWLGAGLALGAALVLALATVFVGLPADPEGSGFGSAISGPIQIGLAALMAMAGAMALRWKAVAAALMALAATGLGLFAAVEYRPLLASLLTAALLIPAILTWLAWQPNETFGRIVTLAAVTTTLLTATALGTTEIYDHYFGPTHPESAAEELESEADWLWLGDVDARSATIVAGGLDRGSRAELSYWPETEPGPARGRPALELADVDELGVARFELTGLAPGSAYGYAVAELSESSDERIADAEFRTFDEGPQDLVVVAGSCARSGSNGAVFDAMVVEQPDLYLALGDLHYANLESTDVGDHLAQYGRALGQPGQAALFSSVPTAYVWDDHDYGPNDSDASSVSRSAVSAAYRTGVPHYGVDADLDASIAQAFTVGRVRFVLSDTRSHRTADSMLGQDQLAWLLDELTSSAETHALVVWGNPTPWIGAAGAGTDDWSAYPDERRTIADALAGVDNLIMVSGDAHMVAIDDGTNSGYTADGRPGFPVLHAAALDRPGSVKGGPYSHGAFPGAGQYGRLVIDDDGGPTIDVQLSGHDWTGEEIVALDLTFAAP